jgi:hypothetical protein
MVSSGDCGGGGDCSVGGVEMQINFKICDDDDDVRQLQMLKMPSKNFRCSKCPFPQASFLNTTVNTTAHGRKVFK